jgi:hypothetical protein
MKGPRASCLLERVREFREDVRSRQERRDGPALWRRAAWADVRKVALILCSPRSGSSLLHCLLKTLPGVCALGGECVPFYKLNGLSSDEFPSDAVPEEAGASPAARAGLGRDLLGDCHDFSPSGARPDRPDWMESYLDDLALRLPMQWPQVNFTPRAIRTTARRVLESHVQEGKGFRKTRFYLRLLSELRRQYKEINPYYYDIPADAVRSAFPGLKVPAGPPCGALAIEEPPFILLEPAPSIRPEDLRNKTLLLKSTTDCYRLDFIASLFPGADIRLLHLIRHPLAAINGLYDGWRHRGFFSHNLRTYFGRCGEPAAQLAIKGYSDACPWGKWWWNFDLPPGWRDYAGKRLEEVCAFQWLAAQRAILARPARRKARIWRVRFEDVVGDPRRKAQAREAISDWLGLDAGQALAARTLPVMQATHRPAAQRWKRRKDILLPLLKNGALQDVAASLGYSDFAA